MGILLDFKYALRNLIKSLRFTMLILFIMVGSLTISLVGFNFIHTIAFSHSDFKNNNDSIRILAVRNGLTNQRNFSYEMMQSFSETKLVAELEEWMYLQRTQFWLSDGLKGEHYRGSYVPTDFFDFIETNPKLGRPFTLDDFASNAPNVAVISHGIWQSMFQGTTEILGKKILVDQTPYTIIGVMEKRNHFPIFSQIWLPTKLNTLKPSDSVEILYKSANQDFEVEMEKHAAHYFQSYIEPNISDSDLATGRRVRIESMTIVERNTDGEAIFIFILFVIGIILVLFISSINIGNLLFIKIIERQKESAIRSAIGATKFRIVQQHACEGILYCLISWVFALLFSSLSLNILNFYMNVMFGDKMPYWWYWQLNPLTVFVSIGLLSIIFMFAVLLPAYKTANFNTSIVLRDGTRGATGKHVTLISKRLLSIQITLVSFMLMIASTVGFVMYSIASNIDGEKLRGHYDADLVYEIKGPITSSEQLHLFDSLAIALKNESTFTDSRIVNRQARFDVLDESGNVYTKKPILIDAISELFDDELIVGRNFNENDNLESNPVAILSESLAISLFGSTDVLNQTVTLQHADWPKVTVIGIAKDEISGVTGDTHHEFYISIRQVDVLESFSVHFITDNDISQSYEAFYQILSKMSKKMTAVYFFDHYDNHMAMINSFAAIIYVFMIVGGFALTLSLIGIYAMGMSNINKSRYEIGIRRAIGSKDSQIVLLYIKKNMRHITIGISTALVIYYVLSYLAVDFLKGNVPFSIMIGTGTATIILVLITILLALYIPVKRAIKDSPAVSLRMD